MWKTLAESIIRLVIEAFLKNYADKLGLPPGASALTDGAAKESAIQDTLSGKGF